MQVRLLVIASLLSAAIAVPASAQLSGNVAPSDGSGLQQSSPYSPVQRIESGGDPRIWAGQLIQLRSEMDRLLEEGRLTHADAAMMLRDLDDTDRVLHRYSAQGIDQHEYWELDRRVHNLRVALRRATKDAG